MSRTLSYTFLLKNAAVRHDGLPLCISIPPALRFSRSLASVPFKRFVEFLAIVNSLTHEHLSPSLHTLSLQLRRCHMPTPRHLLLLQYACLAGVDALLMNEDWLVGRPLETSSLHRSKDVLTLSNGLVSRTFKLSPNFATIDLRSDVTNAGLLRFVQPEALISFSCAPSPDVPVSTMSYRNVSIGGLVGQQLHTQLNFANDGAVNWTSPIGE